MRGMNTVFLIGRAGSSPEVRQSGGARPWCPLRVATRREACGIDGTQVELTDWHEVQLVGPAADLAARRVRRGTVVAVEGRLVYDGWDDEHGQRHRETTIVAARLVVVGAGGIPDLEPETPWVRQHRS